MHEKHDALFGFTVFPIGSGEDVSGPVSAAVDLIDASGLPYQVTGSSTLVEGTWDEVMPVLERCVHRLTEEHPRVYATITMDHHRGETGRLRSSVAEVEKVLDRGVEK